MARIAAMVTFAKRYALAATLLAPAVGCTSYNRAAAPAPGLFVPVPGPAAVRAQPNIGAARPARAPDIVTVAHTVPAQAEVAPLPTPSAKMTLDEVINATLLADPRIRAGLESINQANADALTASLKPNPQLLADGQLLPLTRPFTTDKQGGPPQQDVVVSYSVDWFLFGKRAAAMQAAGLGVRASEAEYADLVRRRVLDAGTGYYDVLEAKSLRDLARLDVENFKQAEAITQKAVDGGQKPRVELDRVRLDRLKSEQTLRDAENALVGAVAKLRALLGRTDADPAFDVFGGTDEKFAAAPLSVEEAFAVAQQNRPDIQALRWKLDHARANTVVEYRKAYPEVTPALGYTRQYQTKAVGFPDANSYSVSVTTALPFFDRNQGNRAKAASVVVQNTHELQGGIVALRAEVEQYTSELTTAAANARAMNQEQLKLAEQVLESIRKSYEAGG